MFTAWGRKTAPEKQGRIRVILENKVNKQGLWEAGFVAITGWVSPDSLGKMWLPCLNSFEGRQENEVRLGTGWNAAGATGRNIWAGSTTEHAGARAVTPTAGPNQVSFRLNSERKDVQILVVNNINTYINLILMLIKIPIFWQIFTRHLDYAKHCPVNKTKSMPLWSLYSVCVGGVGREKRQIISKNS